MEVVCTFLNEPTVVVDVPEGTRFVYVGRDATGKSKIVTADPHELHRWVNDPARVAPWIEPREVVGRQIEEPAVEMNVARMAAE